MFYRTNSPTYKTRFGEVADKVAAILTWDKKCFVTGIGSTTFVVTCVDKNCAQREFFLPGDDFDDCFALVKEMVLGLELLSAVLRPLRIIECGRSLFYSKQRLLLEKGEMP